MPDTLIEDEVYQSEFNLLRTLAPYPHELMDAITVARVTESDFSHEECQAVFMACVVVANMRMRGERLTDVERVVMVQAEFANRGLLWDSEQTQVEFRSGAERRKAHAPFTDAGIPLPFLGEEFPVGEGMHWGPGAAAFLLIHHEPFSLARVQMARRVLVTNRRMLRGGER